jgi:Uma2 family endonuclease
MLHTTMSTARRLDRPATMADLEALPSNVKGEIIDGVLYTMPRPRAAHQHAAGSLYHELMSRLRPGPAGWWILIEPGIELPGSPEVAPDLAGWRRERLIALPEDRSINLVPEWLCEVFSPSTRAYDRRTKMPYYARIGVKHVWLVDPDARTLEVKRLEQGRWLEIGVFADDEPVRAEPFEELELSLGYLWAPTPEP